MARRTTPESNPIVSGEVQQMLDRAPAYQQLDAETQRSLADSMTRIAGYLADLPAGQREGALARQLAPDLRSALAPRNAGGPRSAPDPSQAPQPTAPAPPQQRTSVTGRVGEVTRATLNAIDFPGFVSSLIQGTFQAIVDSSIQQMEAFAELVHNIAGTADQFMTDNISEGNARDYLADRYDTLFSRDTSGGADVRLTVQEDRLPAGEMPSFFRDLGFESPEDIDDEAVEQVIVPATRRTLAEQRQQLLATMVLMGINRVVVDDGEIRAKLQFHVDASEDTELRFDQQKMTTGNMAGQSGRRGFSANGILVNTTSLNAQSDINVRTDLTGEVKVRFRSETFPLERFADSAAIQLINNTARVPQNETQSPPPAVGEGTPARGAASQNDPWAPRS